MLVCTKGLKLSVNGETGFDSIVSVADFEPPALLLGLGELPQALAVRASAVSAAAPTSARGRSDFRNIAYTPLCPVGRGRPSLGKTVVGSIRGARRGRRGVCPTFRVVAC